MPWDRAEKPPPRVRLAGAVSLFAWAGVIAMGRMIAYNWFDCEKLTPGTAVHFLSGCPVESP